MIESLPPTSLRHGGKVGKGRGEGKGQSGGGKGQGRRGGKEEERPEGRKVVASYLGCIQSHAKTLGPIQLLCKGLASASLSKHVKEGASSTKLCDDTGGIYAHSHEHDHIWVAQTRHDGRLHWQQRSKVNRCIHTHPLFILKTQVGINTTGYTW